MCPSSVDFDDMKFSICIDFDGVIHRYDTPWINAATIPDPPVDGTIQWMNDMAAHFTLVVFTTRAQTLDGKLAVEDYLKRNGWEHGFILITDKKPPALLYIDDRAFRFTGPGSLPTAQDIHQMKPWNKL